jgi:hypothetical protein
VIDKSCSLTRERVNVRTLILYSYLIPILLLFFPFLQESNHYHVYVYMNGLQLFPLICFYLSSLIFFSSSFFFAACYIYMLSLMGQFQASYSRPFLSFLGELSKKRPSFSNIFIEKVSSHRYSHILD